MPEDWYCYDLRGSNYDPGEPVTMEPSVAVNHAGTILTHAGADQTMYFLGPFLCTFYLTNTEQTVSYVRSKGKAVIIINPFSLEVTR